MAGAMSRVFLLLSLALTACAPPADPREATVVQALVRADEVLIRSRPTLAAGKFERMASNPYDFFRGTVPLFRADWEAGLVSQSGFDINTQPVLGLGDPHPENFGLLTARDGSLALEPNDFDSADRVPYLFDLRRLLIGLGVGARRNDPSATVEPIALAAATAYANALITGEPSQRITAAPADSAVLDDLFRRGARDLNARAELDLTVVTDGVRTFRRGPPDLAEPTQTLVDVPPQLISSLKDVVTPLNEPVLDAVQEFGSGVASWPRVRFLVLLAGPTDALGDDVIVEVKELTESPLAGWYRPQVIAADTPARVDAAIHRSWSIPDADPHWFTTGWLGVPVQVRTESEANKGINTSRWLGTRGNTAALTALGTTLGEVLARVHRQSGKAVVDSLVAQVGRDVEIFAIEQTNVAVTQTDQLFADYERFRAARERLGPLLGVVVDQEQVPTTPGAVLFQVPQ